MFKNNGNDHSQSAITYESLNEFTKTSVVKNDKSLLIAGTSAVKLYNEDVQNNFSSVAAADSNNSHLNKDLLIPNYESVYINTPSTVGAGFKTFLAFYAILASDEIQQKILKPLMAFMKFLFASLFGGTGTAILLFLYKNLNKFLHKDERLIILKQMPVAIEGPPAQKYYTSIALDQIYLKDRPNIVSVYIDENKLPSFLSGSFQKTLETASSNLVNMNGLKHNPLKTLCLDFKEQSAEVFKKYAFELVNNEIKKNLFYGTIGNNKIDAGYLLNQMTASLREISVLSESEILDSVQKSSNFEVFKNNLYQCIGSIKENNKQHVDQLSRYLFGLLLQYGYKNIQDLLQTLIERLSNNHSAVEQPNWKKLFITNKKRILSPFKLFYFIDNFVRHRSADSNDITTSLNYINSNIRTEIIGSILRIINGLQSFFIEQSYEGSKLYLNINLSDVNVFDLIDTSAFDRIIENNINANFKNLLFFNLISELDNVRLENFVSFESFNSGITIEASLDSFDISEKNLLIEKLQSKYNTKFIDVIPILNNPALIFKIARYCLVTQIDKIHVAKHIIERINEQYYNFDKLDPSNFAAESKYDLLLSRLRTEDNNYKINDEDLFFFALYCYALNVISTNRSGFSISYPDAELKNYFNLIDIQNLLTYPDQDSIRKKFIYKFFEQPQTIIKKLEELDCTNSRNPNRRIVKNETIHSLFQNKLRELLKYNKKLIEMLKYFREKYA